jgi:hypothetical protein
LHIIKFANIKIYPKEISNYDRSLKLRTASDILNLRLSEVNHPTEHVLIGKINVFFEEKAVFRQYIPKSTTIWNKTTNHATGNVTISV